MKKYFLAVILVFLLGSRVYAQSDTISYNEALNCVLNNASDLKNLEDSMTYLDEKKQKTEENRSEFYISLNEPLEMVSGTLTQIINSSRMIMNYENQISNYDMNKKILKDTAEYTLRTHLININNYERDMDLLKRQVKLDQKNLDILELKYKMGMASNFDLAKLEDDIAKEKNNLSILDVELSNEKQALNKLMGLDISTDVQVDFSSVPEETFDHEDIDFYIANQVNNSPVILMKQKELDEAQYNLDSYTSLMDEVKSESINKLNKVSREYEDLKKNLETKIRVAYNNLRSLENSQKILHSNLEMLRENFANNIVKFKSGQISKNDLDKSRLEIFKVRTDIYKNTNSRAKLNFVLNRPYLLG